MRRFVTGLVLTLHGLGHAAAGMTAQDKPQTMRFGLSPSLTVVVATILFFFAAWGFVAAGVCVWIAPSRRSMTQGLARVAAVASALLLVLFARSLMDLAVGLLLDVAFVVSVSVLPKWLSARAPKGRFRRLARHVGQGAAVSFCIYLAALILLRPWHRTWGADAAERHARLPGDEYAGDRQRAGDRAIAIQAPAADVWPWLVQMGEDRGGFYSYATLENVFGLHIVNADRVEPRWQSLAPGDFIRATPPMWLGGAFGDRIGWEVDHVDPEARVLALRYWVFKVESVDERTSRLHIRTHAGNAPVAIAPLLLLTFEPAHFIMERAMLLGIKERAERATTLPRG